MHLTFYDVPVYRLSADEYAKQREQFIIDQMRQYLADKRMLHPGVLPEDDALAVHHSSAVSFHDHLWRKYGGMWDHNEVIGYLRLHFLGSEIRAGYACVDKQRIVRSRTKQFEYQAWRLVVPTHVPRSASSQDIWAAVQEHVALCRKHLKRRYVDSSLLETIGPYVDWKALYEANWQRSVAR
jgi:hypothetical protein